MKLSLTNTPLHRHWHWQPKLKPLIVPPSPTIRQQAAPMAAAAPGPSSPSPTLPRHNRHRDKAVVIMGATGSGKSQLSVDLATLFPSEIINSDKMQVYSGLDITTNKIPHHDRLGIPHHLIGCVDPGEPTAGAEFTPVDFRALGHSVIRDIISRQKLPLIAGGSNSFVYALLAERFDPDADVFGCLGTDELRYNCCFLWVDVFFPVLDDYLRKRVDDMLDSGMFEELVRHYDPDRVDPPVRTGLRKAIGVPEFDRCFRRYPPKRSDTWTGLDPTQRACYEEAVTEIKENTCHLAKRQIGKILRLRDAGWDLQRLDATEALRAAMTAGKGRKWAEIWQCQVLGPGAEIVKRFLQEN
ncbi:hypothetical protein SAY86_019705 [Trapa natans]|uniref:adenylate dimethylallyltransferase (ADP/ATP-dependent) n=1 Tax=Trapa natans TaxID=22666 RepID=A0AAN7R5T5_TRANT|nr:hypothetical protein SAY86_019705 [Trapa natans]